MEKLIAQRGSLEPWIKDEIDYYPHQIEGIRTLAKMGSFLLADDMGLGKTLQSLTVFGIDVYLKRSSTAIVVCPVSLKGNWMDEIEMFTRFPAVELGRGGLNRNGKRKKLTKAERSEQIKKFKEMDGPKILVVNYEQVVAHLKELNQIGFDVSMFDEAHYLKNPRSKRTDACMKLMSRRSFMLTGSPLLNKVDELWVILNRIDPQMYPNYWTFRQRYCVFGGFKNKEIVGVQNERELMENIGSVMLRRLKDDVLDLQKPQIIQRKVDLSDKQQSMYDQAFEELKISVDGEVDDIVIENGMTKLLRLKQICGTTATLLGEDHDDSGKLDQAVADAVELIENGHKVIVFTQFRVVQEMFTRRMKRVLPHSPVYELNGDVPSDERKPVVDMWRDDERAGVINCMLQVAGVGLNMTASRHVMFIDKLFVPKLNQQAVDRAHRIGADKTQPVMVLEYIARGTIEYRIEEINRVKTKLFNELIENPANQRELIKAVLSGSS